MKFTFKGLMAPVFNAFKDDGTRSLDLSIIEPYADFLSKKNVKGVLVNGTSGEGMSMSVEERKKVASYWKKSCDKHGLHLQVQVGGASFADVSALTKHAATELKVDSLLCLPELYFKPKTEQELVEYLSEVAKLCPNTPLLYYHIPAWTGVNLSMPKFLDLMETVGVPNFVGIKYTNGDLDQGSACLKPGRSIFLGADTILVGAIALGFDSAIMTTLSICPEISLGIIAAMKYGHLEEAQKLQAELTQKVRQILKEGGGEWVSSMKQAFNKHKFGFAVGTVRKPLK